LTDSRKHVPSDNPPCETTAKGNVVLLRHQQLSLMLECASQCSTMDIVTDNIICCMWVDDLLLLFTSQIPYVAVNWGKAFNNLNYGALSFIHNAVMEWDYECCSVIDIF